MNHLRNTAALATAVCLLMFACQRGGGEATPETRPAEDCPGATQEQASSEYHPRVLRGRVMAPHAELAGSWTDILVSPAHAAPLEDEQPVAGATVELFKIDTSGQKAGDVLQETRTNAQGEWCLGLPDGIEPAHDLMLRARGDDTELRRLAISPIATDIYTGTEAIVRILEARRVDFHRIPKETYLNMESVADTAVDLLEPVELDDGDDVESLVSKLRETLEDDERFTEKLDTLPTRASNN
ncbi:MAG: hypothetical protein ACQEVA_05150 [Myxococcota bacterium]